MTQPVILITGASSGIGAATARRLAQPGVGLLLHARGGTDGRKVEALENVADEARRQGAEVDIHIADLSQRGTGTEIVAATVQRFGRLDQIVSNAGYALATPIGEMTRADLDNAYAVITAAFADLITTALAQLQRSNCARVVAVSSFVVRQIPSGRSFPATAAAKGAVEALARAFAVQVAPLGITVNCVSPGFTRKDQTGHAALASAAWQAAAAMTPNGRLAEPADIAAAIAFFLSAEASHITGQILQVDGGLSLI